jgi:hypothetical protein
MDEFEKTNLAYDAARVFDETDKRRVDVDG